MTKQEAIDKIRLRIVTSPVDFVNALEALGLIKFEEEKNKLDKVLNAYFLAADKTAFLMDLQVSGYTIVEQS